MPEQSDYLTTVESVYRNAAEVPDVGLCCTTTPMWLLPDLTIPQIMSDMNYGCGSTVNPRDLTGSPTILYVGVGGGMEVLQFSYFARRKSGVIGVDIVDEMLAACSTNLEEAQKLNSWFSRDFVDLRRGSALELPIEDNSIDVAAQNCLFNVFTLPDLKLALSEMNRVLRPHGRLILSDPTCETVMPETLRDDARLRALCLSGALPLNEYLDVIASAGFGTIEVRAKRPYRVLDSAQYAVSEPIYIESVEVCAIKDPMPEDGPCIFTGRSALYYGTQDYFDDGKGHVIFNNRPLSICDKTALALSGLGRQDILITPSTYFYDGGGCC